MGLATVIGLRLLLGEAVGCCCRSPGCTEWTVVVTVGAACVAAGLSLMAPVAAATPAANAATVMMAATGSTHARRVRFPSPPSFPGPFSAAGGAVSAGVVRDIDLGQASLPTPCTEFDVAALQRHLAKATGRPWQPDAAVCEQALAALAPVVQPEYRSEGMPFGPEVAVADDASPLDRFVAFTGRSPERTSDLRRANRTSRWAFALRASGSRACVA
jgi:hypothetical protein